jgi:hypothetical protein
MQRLSIMLATPPGFNAGMAATELALRAFLRRHDLESVARYFRLVRFGDRLSYLQPEDRADAEHRADTGIRFRSAFEEADAFISGTARLFWADYLHMGIYLRELAPIAAAQLHDPAETQRRLARLLLLEGASDAVLAASISFGTTLLFNTLQDEGRAVYAAPLRRFLKRAKRVWVRDALSAARVAHLRGDYEIGYFGVDCALLLTREDVHRNAIENGVGAPAEPGAVLAFFGRETGPREALLAAALDIARALGRPVRWLRWGDIGGFPHLLGRPPGIAESAAATTYELLHEVAHARAVVTDTYHLAVIAWSLGVPALTAFSGHAASANDVSSGAEFNWRDKREVFYSQYDALDFLIRPEELVDGDKLRRRMAHVREAVSDESLCTAIVARIREHATAVEAALARGLHELLAA